MPSIKFKIIGPLQGYNEFSSDLNNLNIDLKAYTKEEFISEADNSDIYIIASMRESFGMTTLEAMSRGCIVISSNTKGSNEFIKDGENGFIVNTKEELVMKIEYIYNNWEVVQGIRSNAITTAKRYSNSENESVLLSIYGNL
ncbi:MAG: glycosyltransferase [Candidatus Dojkabacteria bacterium]|nr:glycosyltransferase [Candidatus Dojkabacteria bacterium]